MNRLFGIVAVLLFVLLGWLCYQDGKHWGAFSAEHHCKVVGRQAGDILPVFGSDGNVSIIAMPDKTGWQCDDGVTYWR